MANLKNITDVPVVESVEGLNLIVNDNGTAKQVPASAVGAQADWNQNDPSASDYVKNRPFWTDTPVDTELYNGVVTVEGEYGDKNIPIQLIVGQEYTVVFDDVTYVLTGIDDGVSPIHIGSESIWRGDDYIEAEPPFAIGNNWIVVISTEGDHTIKISTIIPEVHKIDRGYLPEPDMVLEVYCPMSNKPEPSQVSIAKGSFADVMAKVREGKIPDVKIRWRSCDGYRDDCTEISAQFIHYAEWFFVSCVYYESPNDYPVCLQACFNKDESLNRITMKKITATEIT